MKRKIKFLPIAIFLLLIYRIIFPVCSNAETGEVVNITFKDANLYAALKEKLSASDVVNSDDSTLTLNLTSEAISNFTYVSLSDKGITDLSGMEYFENIRSLDISGNNIKNLDNISRNISLLDISSCYYITDISSISKLTELKELDLSFNNISDISSLENLSNINILDLRSNNISDISAISNLTELRLIYLDNNNISNIDALENKEFYSLNISNNNITDISNISVPTYFDFSYNNITDFSVFNNKDIQNNTIKNQCINLTANSGKTVDMPLMLKQAFENYDAESIETINCTVSSDYTQCTIDKNASFAKIEIVGGDLDNSIIYIETTEKSSNQEVTNNSDNMIKFTKMQLIIIVSIIVIIFAFLILVIIFNKRKDI